MKTAEISIIQKNQLEVIAQRYILRFVIMHGSYATGKQRPGSDLDIAVVGTTKLDGQTYLALYGELATVFGDQPARELDLKTLHHVDPLFRYLVVRDGQLLYGDPTDYEEFKSFAYRTYVDSADLRKLEKKLVAKSIHLTAQQYA